MAQDGDTITYTFSDGTVVSEDVSGVGEAVVDYCDGPGGETNNTSGGSGGRVENATIDVSGHDTLYIWVGGCINQYTTGYGRYPYNLLNLNGTSEISFSNTSGEDSDDEPFLVGAGGGGSGGGGGSNGFGGNAGARGGDGGAGDGLGSDGLEGPSIPPPTGGDGGDANPSQVGGDGDGAIDDQNRGLVSGGTTILGGGAGADTNGEIRITYKSLAPSAPSNVAITDAQTEGELTVDWDTVSGASGYYVYRAELSGSAKADYTQVADVSSPPYTDTALEDGERYYYRVSSHD